MQIRDKFLVIKKILFGFLVVFFMTGVLTGDDFSKPESLHFIYHLSGKSAVGLMVFLTDYSGDAKTHMETTDAQGCILGALTGKSIRVLEPRSGLTLLNYSSLEPGRTEIRLPLPIRLQGKIVCSDKDKDFSKVLVHYGFGKRIAVSDYQRTYHRLRLVYHKNENHVHGIELPTIASQWKITPPNGDGIFLSDWIAVKEVPQLLVVDHRNRMAALDVKLPPNLESCQSIFVGDITPKETCTLEINLDLPKTDLPLSLVAGIESVEINEKEKERIALHLSMLNRLDGHLSLFTTQRAPYPLLHRGTTRIEGLPSFKKLSLYIIGPVPGIKAERSVELKPGKKVRLDLSEMDILGDPVQEVPMTGVVNIEGTREPVKNARIVYSSYPDRFETTTDKNGHFFIPCVKTGRNAVIFIEAYSPGNPPPFDRVTTTKRVRVPTGIIHFKATFEIPVHQPGKILRSEKLNVAPGEETGYEVYECTNNTQYQIPYKFEGCLYYGYTQDMAYAFCPAVAGARVVDGGYVWENIEVQNIVISQGGEAVVKIRVQEPGQWTFYIAYTPFVYSMETMYVSEPEITVEFQPKYMAHRTVITVYGQNRQPVPGGTEITFSSWIYDIPPFSMLTDQNGQIFIKCINTSPLWVYVNSEYGCFDGEFNIPLYKEEINLQSCNY